MATVQYLKDKHLMQNIENLLKLLPGSWDELKLKDFLKIVDVVVKDTDDMDNLFVGLDNMVSVISVLTSVSVKELEEFQLESVNRLVSKISFIQNQPKPAKTSIQWKKLEEISYNDYVFYISQSKDLLHNMPAIIKTFSKAELTEEQIKDLSMSEVHAGFFTLNKQLKKSTKSMLRQSLRALAKNKVKEGWKNILTRLNLAAKGER